MSRDLREDLDEALDENLFEEDKVEKENEDEDNNEDDDDEKDLDEALDVDSYKISSNDVSSETFDKIFEEDGKELSEDFKNKMKIIFESTVTSSANAIISEAISVLNERYKEKIEFLDEKFEEAKDVFYEELVDKTDGYLSHIVEDWKQENAPVLEHNINVELSESFMKGLKNLFEEHYIEIPESKVDVVNALTEELEEMENSLNEEMKNNLTIHEEVRDLKKRIKIIELSEDLSKSQAERLESLVEGIDYTDDEKFEESVKTIKECYFSKREEDTSALQEETEILNKDKSELSIAERRGLALSRYLKK